MKILGIDTSTSLCSVGVLGGRSGPVEQSKELKNTFSERIFEIIGYVLRQAALESKSLDGIAVNKGPGSFTGVRVGLSTAKGLAHSLTIPIVGVTAFRSLVHGLQDVFFPVCCVVPIKNEKVSYALYSGPPAVNDETDGIPATWSDIPAICNTVTTLCGDIPETFQKELTGHRLSELNLMNKRPSAQAVAEAGREKLSRGLSDDLTQLAQVYMHEITFQARSTIKGLH